MHWTVKDWSDAYENGGYIVGADALRETWVADAAAFRAENACELDLAYGDNARHRFDLFHPEGQAQGLLVFVHGGYWMAMDKSAWSHLAAGALKSGWAVAMPSYRLTPEVRIGEITRDVAAAIDTAGARIDGPVRLTGHSAGGHLVGRMACANSPLSDAMRTRLEHVVPISGLFDLRPIMRTAMNDVLGIDPAEARTESPALLDPAPDLKLTAWVGGSERHEFLRQSALIANVWHGCGAATACVVEPNMNHFSVIEGLRDPTSPLVRALLD